MQKVFDIFDEIVQLSDYYLEEQLLELYSPLLISSYRSNTNYWKQKENIFKNLNFLGEKVFRNSRDISFHILSQTKVCKLDTNYSDCRLLLSIYHEMSLWIWQFVSCNGFLKFAINKFKAQFKQLHNTKSRKERNNTATISQFSAIHAQEFCNL